MPTDEPTELSRIKLKTWTPQPISVNNEHSDQSTPLHVGIRTWLWRYTCLLLLNSMLWHRQSIFESKGDKMFSSSECIRTQRVSGTESLADVHTYIHTYIHAYLHTYKHTYMHTYLLLLISMLWHRQAIFESKGDKLSSSAENRIRTHQGLRYQIASRLNARWQTDWAIEDHAKKLELDSPSLWSTSIQPTRPHSRLAFAPGSGDIHICCC